jgi:hypothetical protein
MAQSLPMDRRVLVKHIQWREAKLKSQKEVSFQEHSSTLLSPSKVNDNFISGTPGVNFMVQVSML